MLRLGSEIAERVQILLPVGIYPAQKLDSFVADTLPVNGEVQILNRNVLSFLRLEAFQALNDYIKIVIELFVVIHLLIAIEVDGKDGDTSHGLTRDFVINKWKR